MKKLLFIYNPHAGRGQVRGKLAGVLNAFAREGCLTTVWPTQGRGDATVAARTADGYDCLACCGGDGTLHEVITGLLDLPKGSRPPLGYLPAGTTNDFARNLDLPSTMEEMAHTAVTGTVSPVDIGRLGDQYFVYVAAFGACTDTAYSTPQELKNLFGHLAYVLRGVGELSSLKSWRLKIEYDGGELEGDFLYGMVSNTISVGGLIGLPAQEVSLSDGLLEGVFVRTPATAQAFQSAVRALARQEYTPESGVVGLHSTHFKITSAQPVRITLDGEYGGEHTEMDLVAVNTPISIIRGNRHDCR